MINCASRSVSIILLTIMLVSTIPAMADPGAKGPSPNYATVDVHLTYQNGSDAIGMQVFLSHYGDFGPGAVFAVHGIGGNYSLIAESSNWGPSQIYAHDIMNDLWWFQKQYIEPNGRYTIEGVIGPHLPSVNKIHGVVRNASSGLPIKDAPVSLYGYDVRWFQFSADTLSGPDGSYELKAPNSTNALALSVDADGFRTYAREVHFMKDEVQYGIDIDLVPISLPSVPVRVRMVNTTTGDHLPIESLSLYGLSGLMGHFSTSVYTTSYDTLTGHASLMVNTGEYRFQVYSKHDLFLNVSITTSGYLNVGDDPIDLDLDIPMPEWRTVDVLLHDTDGPIYYGYIDYDLRSNWDPFDFSIDGSTHTLSDGSARIMIPVDRDVDLNFNHYDHEGITFTIPAGTDPVDLDVPLDVQNDVALPLGDVSILVRDEISGVPIPYVHFYGSVFLEDGIWTDFYGSTGSNGYYNGTGEAVTFPLVTFDHPLGYGEVVNLTISEVGTTEITVDLKRADYPTDPVEVNFLLRRPEGILISNQPITLSDGSGTEYILVSDDGGQVAGNVVPGRYTMYVRDEYDCLATIRSQYVMPEIEIVIDDEGGMLPDITLYPSGPLFSVDGMVLDSVTGDPIREQDISMSSRRYLDDAPSRQLPYVMPYFFGDEEEDRPLVDLFYESGGSDHTGYYRLWGRESASIAVWREGYYSFHEDLNLTGTVPDHDIMMMPVPELTAPVTGTLVDGDGTPLNGSVLLVDPSMNDHEIDWQMVNDTGVFSLMTYPGSIRAVFGNASLWDYIDIDVPIEGIADLKLVLSPSTFINGTVTDWRGDPVAGINVTLSGGWGSVVFENVTKATDEDGRFTFNATRGIYRIDIPDTGETLPKNVSGIECNGWIPLDLNITLSEMTEGWVHGRIVGIGGPMDGEGIPNAFAVLIDMDANRELIGAVSDEDGHYSFDEMLPFGTSYAIYAEPPKNLSGKSDIRSGYFWNFTNNFTLDSFDTEIVIGLAYIHVANMTWVNITDFGPRGEDVNLNEPITINFTHHMQFSLRVIISDPPINITREGHWDGTTVSFDHVNFEPNTLYTITIPGDILSKEGYPLRNHTGITWSFKTGSTFWHIDDFSVDVFNGRSIQVDAWGGANQTVFIIINEVGSYQLDEIDPGHYRVFVGEEYLSWDSYYSYYFSDTENGKDDDPDLRGEFRTYTGGKPPQYYEEENYQNEPDLVGCLACCGIGIAVVLVIVGVVLLLSKIKSRYDEKEE